MNLTMKICVISDMHCKYKSDENDKSETFLFSNGPRIPATQHPVAALLNLIKLENLRVDYLVCPGDLGDRADEQGIQSAWQSLEEIHGKLGSRMLIGLPGNHDINSRQTNKKGPFEYIEVFHERFPFESEDQKNKFWRQGYCYIPHDNTLFLVFNTVHNHTDSDKAKESEIKPEMLEAIEKEYSENISFREYSYKVAVLHHHPIHHSDIKNWRDTDLVNNGDKLLQLLNRQRFQIVIHGHKHQPRLIEVDSLPVFAAGSFSSFANLQGTGINTMFHIIELNENDTKGFIYSWEYDIANGWQPKLNSKFPPKVGFGATKSIEEIAKSINSIFEKKGRKPMLFDTILENEIEISFTIPEKLRSLKDILKNKYGIVTNPEFPIEPNKISSLLIKQDA